MYKEKIIDLTTGEETWRNYTAEEIAEVKAAEEAAKLQAIDLAAKDAARQVVLDKLGLSADELAALLG